MNERGRMWARYALLCYVLAAVLLSFSTGGAAELKLWPEEGSPGDLFGAAVGMSHGLIIIGAPGDGTLGANAGAAFIYERGGGGWDMARKLTAAEGAPGDDFGRSVAISDDWAVVGASHYHGRGYGTGAVFVHRRLSDGWGPGMAILPDELGRNDHFGRSVAISQDRLIIGAHGDDDRGMNAGAAYIYRYTGAAWTREAKLTVADGGVGDAFGWAVSISGDTAVVGAIHADDPAPDTGAAYLFEYSGGQWRQSARLLPAAGEGDFLGFSVAVSGQRAIIGACGDDDRGRDAGAAYLFAMDGGQWGQTAKLTASDGGAGDFFGRSVAIYEDRAVVGADGDDDVAGNGGAAYLFRLNGSSWGQDRKMVPSNALDAARLGCSVLDEARLAWSALDGARLGWSVGLWEEDALMGAGGTVPGSVHFFADPTANPRIQVSPLSLTLTQGDPAINTPAGPTAKSEPDYLGVEKDSAYGKGVLIPREVRDYWSQNPRRPPMGISDDLPAIMDWSKYDSPVRRQGSCGSCWAFAAVALVENLVIQAGLVGTEDLSEQTLVSCDNKSRGCSGGWPADGLNYIVENGIPSESCHPYEAAEGSCSDRCQSPSFMIKARDASSIVGMWGESNYSVKDLKVALQKGPLAVCMRVPDDGTFLGANGYKSGIYRYEGDFIPWDGNAHAVLLVGYNENEQYFRVKNSWGADWGENGYFRISYDEVDSHVKFGSYGASASGVYMQGSGDVVAIANTGGADLRIESIIASDSSWLAFSPLQLLPITPESRRELSLYVSDWSDLKVRTTGTLSILSNDPLEGTVTVSVTAVPFLTGDGHALAGDLDDSGAVDLKDAVMALRVMAGITLFDPPIRAGYSASGADVNGDGRIGMPEAVYIMSRVSMD